ncbi:MAG: OmpA family protein [Fimbriimonadaceae bacterium]|nr:OmpA family protein [Fimbriimonadaceae bacterium]
MQDGAPIIIKKVRKGGHGHHGGAWKVALADFMTAMMAFFLVMWIVGLSQEERSVIQAYFNDPIGFMKNPPKTPINLLPPGGPRNSKDGESGSTMQKMQEAEAYQKVEAGISNAMKNDPELAQLVKEGKVELRLTNEGLVVEFVENEENGEVFFGLGSWEVRDSARGAIRKVARILGELGRPIKVQGHTDARPFSRGGMDNFDLSGMRANAVRRLLLDGGVRERQIVGVDALAATQPRLPRDPNHFSNRRVTVMLPYAVLEQPIKNLPAAGFGESREAHFLLPKGKAMQIRPDMSSDSHADH